EVREALLGADRRARLRLRVELDAEPAAVQIGDREPELRDAATRRVAVVARVADRLAELVDRDRRRRDVGVAEPQVDDVGAGPPRLHLQRLDGAEHVGRERVDPTEVHPSITVSGAPRRAGYRFDTVGSVQAVLLDLGGVFYLPDHDRIVGALATLDLAIAHHRLDEAHYHGVAALEDFRDGDHS